MIAVLCPLFCFFLHLHDTSPESPQQNVLGTLLNEHIGLAPGLGLFVGVGLVPTMLFSLSTFISFLISRRRRLREIKSCGVSMGVLRWSLDGSVLHGIGPATYDLLPFPVLGLELNDCIG